MASLKRVFVLSFSDGIPKRAFGAALLVGTILNLINQGDALWGQR
jgi:hypothetical protein